MQQGDKLVITTPDRLGRSRMVFTVMAALAQMELEIKRERINDSVAKRRAAGRDLAAAGGSSPTSQILNARRLVDGSEPATQIAKDLGMSPQLFAEESKNSTLTGSERQETVQAGVSAGAT